MTVRYLKIDRSPLAITWPAPRQRILMMTISNHFAPLLDPVGILGACAQSGALDTLPVSAKRSADRMNPSVSGELAEHDAAVEELYLQLVAEASKTSPAKSKEMVRNPEA